MSKPRVDLHRILEDIVGTKHVYFQPPDGLKIEYPAIIYKLNDIENASADNLVYTQKNAYQIIVIDQNPDSEISKRVSKLQSCQMMSAYSSDRLNHFVYNLYF